jgi:replicative DNA helicase
MHSGGATVAERHDPWDTPTEQAVLGTALRYPEHLDTLATQLKESDFHDPYHARMWGVILHVRETSAVNIRTLTSALRSDPAWEETEGENYLDALRLSCPAMFKVDDYVGILKDLSGRRMLLSIGKGLIEDAFEPPMQKPTAALSGAAMEALLQIGSNISRPAVKPYDVAARVIERAHGHLRGEKPPSVTTGLRKLNKAIGGGLQATDLMGVAARSGMAKTSLLRSIGLAAARDGCPTLFFSKEMTDEQLTQGMLCDLDFDLKTKDEPTIPAWKFRAGCLSSYELGRLETAQAHLADLPLEICDDADLTMGSITARSRAFQSRHKGRMGVVLVDFLQIVTDETTSRTDSREQVVTRLAYGHKRLAKMLGWPVVVAIQLKNKGDGKTPRDALPTADDIRESGGIEMACDLLVSPHRQAFFHKLKEPTVPHERPEWVTWNEKMKEIENSIWLRGFKNRHGDPSALNLELWCDMSAGAIRDERPHRLRLGEDGVADEDLKF